MVRFGISFYKNKTMGYESQKTFKQPICASIEIFCWDSKIMDVISLFCEDLVVRPIYRTVCICTYVFKTEWNPTITDHWSTHGTARKRHRTLVAIWVSPAALIMQWCSQNAVKLRTSKGEYWIKNWFSTIMSLFTLELLLKERICSQREINYFL